MSSLHIKVGDTRPWRTTLTSDGDDDLQQLESVALYLKKGSVVKIDGGAAAVESKTADEAVVRYDPAEADVDTAGTYRASWVGTFTGGRTGTFPSKGFDEVVIEGGLPS